MPSNLSNLKRDSIITGATRLFLEQGFNNVSMEKVAQAAPVSKATLYNYFDSKHNLLVAVVDELCHAISQTFETLSTDTNKVESNLKQIALSFMDLIYSKEGIAIYGLIIAECKTFPELGILIYQVALKDSLLQLEQYLQALNNTTTFNIDDTAFAANAFFGVLKGEQHFQCLLNIKALPTQLEKQTYINKIIPLYMQGFLHDTH